MTRKASEWVALIPSSPITAPRIDMEDVLTQFRSAVQDGRVVYGDGAAFAEIQAPIPPVSAGDYIVMGNPE